MTGGGSLPEATFGVRKDGGYAASRRRSKAQMLQIYSICFGEVIEGTYVTLPYTVAAYMVRAFLQGSALPPKALEAKIGQLTGLLAATFPAAQFCTSYALGLLSNRIGRKPIVVLSQVSGIFTTVAFGMSPFYAVAFASRFTGGALNNTGGTIRVMLGEMCDAEMLPRAMSYQAIGWGLGTILGPMLGGALSSPCVTFGQRFPLCSAGSLFHERPFLLPCLAAACLGVIGSALTIFVVQESLPRMTGAARYAPVMELAALDLEEDDSPLQDRSVLQDLNTQNTPNSAKHKGRHASARPFALDREQSGSENQDPAYQNNSLQRLQADPLVQDSSAHAKAQWQEAAADAAVDEEQAPLVPNSTSSAAASRALPWYKQRQVILAILLYTAIAGFFNYLDELRPIFASAPVREGGLGLTTDVLAWSLGCGGIAFMLYSYCGFERLHRLLGSNWTARTGLLLLAGTAMTSVLPSLFPQHFVWVQVCLISAMVINALADTNGYAACALLVNKAAPNDLAAVNGASQTFAALVRAAGPALSGLAWAGSIRSGVPHHQFLPFASISLLAVCLLQLFAQLRDE